MPSPGSIPDGAVVQPMPERRPTPVFRPAECNRLFAPVRDLPHGMLLRVAALEETLAGKIKAWRTPERRPSESIKDIADIARLVEAHPGLRATLPEDVARAMVR